MATHFKSDKSNFATKTHTVHNCYLASPAKCEFETSFEVFQRCAASGPEAGKSYSEVIHP
jgi:hypothetical protein